MSSEAVFVRHGPRYVATRLGLGPWYPGALHGGAPAALVMRGLTEAGADPALQVARVSYEFVRPVPAGQELSLEVQPARSGRRSALYEVSLAAPGGRQVLLARALLLAPSELGPPPAPPPFPGPGDGRAAEMPAADHPTFATHAVEIRFVEGTFMDPGPATAWFRLRDADRGR